jgi:hypothetical protein
LNAIRDELAGRSRLGAVLVMNGADHHARQLQLDEALAAHAAAAKPDEFFASSLGAFAADVTRRAAGAELPEIRGELRDSYGFVWTLQGTLATRAHQKRRHALAERALVRDAEPWAAFAARRGMTSRKSLVDAAWRSLLLCQPHDTLCGCSTDEVARAMDARLDEAHAQAAACATTPSPTWSGTTARERANIGMTGVPSSSSAIARHAYAAASPSCGSPPFSTTSGSACIPTRRRSRLRNERHPASRTGPPFNHWHGPSRMS